MNFDEDFLVSYWSKVRVFGGLHLLEWYVLKTFAVF